MPNSPYLFFLTMMVLANFHACINQREENSPSAAVSTPLALLNGATTELSALASSTTLSPTSSHLNIATIDSWTSTGFDVIDFDPQGQLFSVGGIAPPSLPECFAIAVVIEPRISGSTQSYLITSYKGGAVSDLPSLTYCTLGSLTAENKDAANNFLLYWQSRDSQGALSLTNIPSKALEGSLEGGLGKIERPISHPGEEIEQVLETASPKKIVKPSLVMADKNSPTTSIRDLSPVEKDRNKSLSATSIEKRLSRKSAPMPEELSFFNDQITSFRSKSIKERVSVAGNTGEAEFYASLRGEIKTIGEPHKGSSVHVDSIMIDGKEYTRRIETVPHDHNLEEWKAKKKEERTASLLLGEINREHPDVVITPDLCFVGDREYVSLWPVLKGDLRTALKSKSSASLASVPEILSRNLEILHGGVPFSHEGVSYQLSFFHNDLKPENISFTSEKKPVFTTSEVGQPVVWRKLPDGTYEAHGLQAADNGEWKLTELQVLQKGTLSFMDRESCLYEPGSLTAEGRFKLLKDANVSALNIVNFELVTGKSYREYLSQLVVDKGKTTLPPILRKIGDYKNMYNKPKMTEISRTSPPGQRPLLSKQQLADPMNVLTASEKRKDRCSPSFCTCGNT